MQNWLDDALIYHVFIDRFAGYNKKADPTTPTFCGGNIHSIIDKIDHIKKIGANTLLLSPFYKTSAYHGYHITNFREVDKRFGSLNDLKNLIKKCKENGIKIIADIVPNHCSIEHPWFIDATTNEDSDYKKWFYFRNWPHDYLTFMGFKELVKINLEKDEVSGEMMDSLLQWAKLGFNGFRIDHVIGIPNKFLLELKNQVRKIDPEFVLIGEAWGEGMKYKYLKTTRLTRRYNLWKEGFPQHSIQKAYEGILDGVFDFGWRNLLLENLNFRGKIDNSLKQKIQLYDNQFTNSISLVRFLDNHDTNRIMFMCGNNPSLFKEYLKLLFSQKTPIAIYYGTESGMSQHADISLKIPFADLQARNVLNWQKKFDYQSFLSDLTDKRKAGMN